MSKSIFHSSIEGAQHGPKGLDNFLAFAKQSGAGGAQPSNYMLDASDDGMKFKTADEIKSAFEKNGLKMDGISGHCPFWLHTSLWTGTKSGNPFVHGSQAGKSVDQLESFYEDYCLRLMDLMAELNIKILPMFWGVAFGWEMATGYPWGFWAGDGFDLMKEGQERFVKKTQKIRDHANSLGMILAHEIHPGTGAMCADEFNMLVDICDGDKCLGVNADPSHCWEGEDWETRFNKVGDRIYGCHVKNFTVHRGIALRKMDGNWHNRAMQFTDLATGDLNMTRYVEVMMKLGYHKAVLRSHGYRFCPLGCRSRKQLP